MYVPLVERDFGKVGQRPKPVLNCEAIVCFKEILIPSGRRDVRPACRAGLWEGRAEAQACFSRMSQLLASRKLSSLPAEGMYVPLAERGFGKVVQRPKSVSQG